MLQFFCSIYIFFYFFFISISGNILDSNVSFHFSFVKAQSEDNSSTIEKISNRLKENLDQVLKESHDSLKELEKKWQIEPNPSNFSSLSHQSTPTNYPETDFPPMNKGFYALPVQIREETLNRSNLGLGAIYAVKRTILEIINMLIFIDHFNQYISRDDENNIRKKVTESLQTLEHLLTQFTSLILDETNADFHLSRQYWFYFENVHQVFLRDDSINLDHLGFECTSNPSIIHHYDAGAPFYIRSNRKPLLCHNHMKTIMPPFEWELRSYFGFSLFYGAKKAYVSNTYATLSFHSIKPKFVDLGTFSSDYTKRKKEETREKQNQEITLSSLETDIEIGTYYIKFFNRFLIHSPSFFFDQSKLGFVLSILQSDKPEFWSSLKAMIISPSNPIDSFFTDDGKIHFLYFNDFKTDENSSETNYKTIQNGEVSFIGNEDFIFFIKDSTGEKGFLFNSNLIENKSKKLRIEQYLQEIETNIEILNEYLLIRKNYLKNLITLSELISDYIPKVKSKLKPNEVVTEEYRVLHHCNEEKSEYKSIADSLVIKNLSHLMSAIDEAISLNLIKLSSDLDPLISPIADNVTNFILTVLNKCIPEYKDREL